MPKKNDILTLEITDLTSEGAGVGKHDGYVLFVPGTAPGDVIEAHVLKADKSYGYAKISKIIKPSPMRTDVDCSVFGKCGGCLFRHIKYENELEIKKSWVLENFRRIGKFDISDIEIHSAGSPIAYRNKAQYPASKNADGKLVFGFYASHSHRVVPCSKCFIHPYYYEIIKAAAEDFCNTYKLEPYNDETGKGIIRHLYIRDGRLSGETMISLIINADSLPKSKIFVEKMLEACPDTKSISLIINKKRGNEILGDKCITIYGKDTITDKLCGLDFDISPLSFYQINRDGAELLYGMAAEYAGLGGGETLIDLYCGAGTIGLSMARNVKRLIGVEIIPAAIENAKENARKNGINNAEFICGDAGVAAVNLAEKNIKPDVLIVDPPRKGCGKEVFEATEKMMPERIVMISCNSATGARDAELFAKLGYTLDKLAAVDMFPRTGHVETVVLLSQLKSTDHIKVEIDLTDDDLTPSEAKGTYDDIKKYIHEKYQVKVSSLYISQIKRKLGLPVGESYNKPKSEDARVPHCPQEKEKLIVEALRHFKMI